MLVETISHAADSGGVESIPTGEVSSGWKIPFDGSDSEPVIHNGTLYIGSFDGAIYAINPENGKQIWRFQTGENSPRDNIIYTSEKSFGGMVGVALDGAKNNLKGRRQISATPVIEDGVVYIGSKDHSFYALDAQSGKLKWATDIGHQIFQEALVTNDNIIVYGIGMGSAPEVVYVLRKVNGEVAWSTEGKGTEGKGSASEPYLNNGVLYYVLSEPILTGWPVYTGLNQKTLSFSMNAIEENTGKQLWTLELLGVNPEKVYGSPDLVYVSAYKVEGKVPNARNNGFYTLTSAYIYAINASTGKLVWEFNEKSNVGFENFNSYGSPPLTLVAEYIYFVSKTGLYALDKSTGKKLWFLEGKFSQFNTVKGKFLYVNGASYSKNKQWYAINPKTGKVIWTYKDKGLYFMKEGADSLYISANHGLAALNSATGKKLWKLKTGGIFKAGTYVSASPLIFENHVIFPTRTNKIWGKDDIQGYLYSIDARTGKVN